MKKKILTLVATIFCIFSLVGCGSDIAKEAAEKGRGYFDSGDYETAAKAFGLAIENGSEDNEVQLLYDITLGYYQANKAYEEKDYKKAKKIIEGIDKEYESYGIKEKILTLQNDILKAEEAEVLLDDVAAKLGAGDLTGAVASAEKIDTNVISKEQADELIEYKTRIAEIQAEQVAKAEAQKAEASKKETPKKNTQKAETPKKESKPVEAKPDEKPADTVPSAPAINVNVASDQYIYPTDTTLLTADILKTMKKEDLALIRNEIYARKGHIFDKEKYISYFSQKSWYKPVAKVGWAELSTIEKKNIAILKEFEGK